MAARSRPELEAALRDHREILGTLGERFDTGSRAMGFPLAVSTRVLVHDTSVSHSLLTQLKLKDRLNFRDTALHIDPHNLLPNFGLVIAEMRAGEGASWRAPLDELSPERLRDPVAFDDWWGTPITKDGRGKSWTRSQLVLAVANQEGGAHVDPKRDEDLRMLEDENAMGFVFTDPIVGGGQPFLNGPALPSIRQIAHELEQTLDAAEGESSTA